MFRDHTLDERLTSVLARLRQVQDTVGQLVGELRDIQDAARRQMDAQGGQVGRVEPDPQERLEVATVPDSPNDDMDDEEDGEDELDPDLEPQHTILVRMGQRGRQNYNLSYLSPNDSLSGGCALRNCTHHKASLLVL